MRRVVPLLITALLAYTATAVYAQGKSTIDPNASGTAIRPKDEDVKDTDSRLARKVSYEARRKSILTILTELSKTTGVTLKAGYNDSDWQVRDRKMNLFAKDATLASVMNSVARVMKFKWKITEKNGAPSYRLYMDRKTLLDAEARRVREEERLRKEQIESRKDMLKRFSQLEGISQAELQKLKSENPFLYVLTTAGVAPSFGRFFNEAPSALDALASGKELAMSSRDLSPKAKSALIQGTQSLMKLMAAVSNTKAQIPDLNAYADRLDIHLNNGLERQNSMNPLANSILGVIEVGVPAGKEAMNNADFPFIDPSSRIAGLIGELLIKATEGTQNPDELQAEFERKIESCIAAEMKKADFGDPLTEHADDSSLHSKIKMPGRLSPELGVALQALAKASGCSILSDSFECRSCCGVPPSIGETELKPALDKIALAFNCNWDKHGSVIEFKDRFWFKKRAAQIPDAWVEKWRKAFTKTRMLEIYDMAEIAELTPEQFDMNISGDDLLGEKTDLPGQLYANRDLLRLYGTLDDTQRAAVFSEAGLDLRSLDPDQWPLVEDLLRRKDASLIHAAETPLEFIGKWRTGEAEIAGTARKRKFTNYSFKIARDEGLTPLKWSVSAATYRSDEELKKIQEPAKPDASSNATQTPPKPPADK